MEEKKVTCADDAREISEANVSSIEEVLERIGNIAKCERQLILINYNSDLMLGLAKLGFKVSIINQSYNHEELLSITW
jgi:hypothetical protein